MPKAFDECYERGGKVRTEQLGKGYYRRYCIDPKTGQKYYGHKEKRKKK